MSHNRPGSVRWGGGGGGTPVCPEEYPLSWGGVPPSFWGVRLSCPGEWEGYALSCPGVIQVLGWGSWTGHPQTGQGVSLGQNRVYSWTGQGYPSPPKDRGTPYQAGPRTGLWAETVTGLGYFPPLERITPVKTVPSPSFGRGW